MNPIASTNDSKSAAFRLPTTLLETTDNWCVENAYTRSLFFRNSIADRVRWLGVTSILLNQQTWSRELYTRLHRKG
jgi:hypothetical protein